MPLFAQWMIRVVAWDGIMPLVIIFVPLALASFLPKNGRGWIELSAVTLPIAAFFMRAVAGSRYISKNYCSARLRSLQRLVFVGAILAMVIVDCVGILTHAIGRPLEVDEVHGAIFFIGTAFVSYFAAMAFAMYPGIPPHEDPFEKLRKEEERLRSLG